MLEDIKRKIGLLKGQLAGLHFGHITRKSNKGADVLEKKGISRKSKLVLWAS